MESDAQNWITNSSREWLRRLGYGYSEPAKRPRDPNQFGKMIVGIATGEVEDREPTPEGQGKSAKAVVLARGKAGGLKGGVAHGRTYHG
jgi:hypothetical protein